MYRPQDVRVLIVDDESSIVEFLELGLRHEGYPVMTAHSGMQALQVAREFRPHVAVLDIMMPVMDGLELCRMMKKAHHVAIIMLTAKDEVGDRVKGLMNGADDYMAKPFSFEELLARINARIRNQFPDLLSELSAGPFQVNQARREIHYRDEVLNLSATEFELLRYLVINHGVVLSKAKILDEVWGYDFGGQENIVEVYIRSLREKLGDTEHQIIRTIRGAGYRVDLP